jgi:uncharacterized protein (TIGR02145 family)
MRNRHSSHPVNPLIGVQTIIAATLALAITFTLSCTSPIDVGSGGDNGGGKGNDIGNYRTVQIGDQVWMAENLNYNAPGSKCFGEGGEVRTYDQETDTDIYTTLSNAEVQANCTRYGKLYDWNTAKAACPKGWHLPSDEEWQVLTDLAGGDEVAGKKLKTRSGWYKNGNGTDIYGFAALPGGYGHSVGNFRNVGDNGYWWSATENYTSYAYGRCMRYYHDGVDRNDYKDDLFSVRCVKD